MSGEAMDENVEQLHAMTCGSLTLEQCKKLLMANGNDLNIAINKFFDDDLSSLQEQTWDSTAFQMDRYGQTDSNLPTFHIDYAPGLVNYPHSGAPSRPPSRTSHHSMNSNTNDRPLPSVETAQETGIVGYSGAPQFGPATKEHYDASQWALVPTSTTVELIPDPSPSERKRAGLDGRAPCVLKPLSNKDYLPAMLTILHSIPLFRNAFLAAERDLSPYAFNREWWKGGTDFDGPPAFQTSEPHSFSVIREIQRIMAFLEFSDRAYGSVEQLLKMEPFSEMAFEIDATQNPDFHKFLSVWAKAYKDSVSPVELSGVLMSKVRAAGDLVDSWFLDATAIHRNQDETKTLYDVLDDHMFSSPSERAFVVDLSNVVILKLTRSDTVSSSLDVEIPSTFYPDRYMEKNASIVNGQLDEIKKYEDEIVRIDNEDAKIRWHDDKRTGKKLDGLKLLETSMKAFQPSEEVDPQQNAHNERILSQIRKIYENVERKLKTLEEQKKKLHETLKQVREASRAPIYSPTSTADTSNSALHSNLTSDPHATPPLYLRGVSTKPNVFYLVDSYTDSDGEQWWRIEYAYDGSEPWILREKVAIDTVLQRASQETSEVLLVYASDAAINATRAQVPTALLEAVDQDNQEFFAEIQQEMEVAQSLQDWNLDTNADPPDYDMSNTVTEWNDNTWDANQGYDENSYQTNSGFESTSDHAYQGNSAFPSAPDNSFQNNSAFSSTTLTENTDVDVEMREIGPGGATRFINPAFVGGHVPGNSGMNGAMMNEDEVVDVHLEPEPEAAEDETTQKQNSPVNTAGEKRPREEDSPTIKYAEFAQASAGTTPASSSGGGEGSATYNTNFSWPGHSRPPRPEKGG